MLVWGEDLVLGQGNTIGKRYDLATNNWTSIPAAPEGSSRTTPSTPGVWTGTEFIVWGGCIGAMDCMTGKRFNPTTNTWTAMSSVDAPLTRNGYAAVWTGSHIIYFGGWRGGPINTGAIYDPVSDSWTHISTVDAPKIHKAQAVWTGNKMIVWGLNENGDPAGGVFVP